MRSILPSTSFLVAGSTSSTSVDQGFIRQSKTMGGSRPTWKRCRVCLRPWMSAAGSKRVKKVQRNSCREAVASAEESTSIPLITQGQTGPTTPDTFGAAQLQNNNANQLLRSVGYAVDENNKALITPEMTAAVEAAKAKIISGEL